MSIPVSIFKFASHLEFLSAVGQRYLPRGKRTITANDWAKRLGYRSPQSISMVMTGQRLPGPDMIDKLATELKLAPDERRYFELLVAMDRAKRSGSSFQHIVDELTRLNPQFARQQALDVAGFAYVAAWYHLVIEQLVGADDFEADPDWIRKKLRAKITRAEAANALETLERLGLLERDLQSGRLRRSAHGLRVEGGFPSAAIRLHHRQMITRSLEALEEQSTIDERETRALTLRFDRKRLSEAKAFLKLMEDQFNKQFYADNSADIYQLNIQLFNHTITP